jgi:hypothetical protein
MLKNREHPQGRIKFGVLFTSKFLTMKYLLMITLALGFLSCEVNGQPTSFGEADLQVDKEVHDYGQIEQFANGECFFEITNRGDQPLIISKCDKTCGCTIPKCDPTPIPTGETSIITVTYDTKRIGPFTKSVKVHSNDPDEPVKILKIKGEVSAG